MSQSFHERRGAHRPSGLGPAGAVPWLIAAVAVVLIVAYASGWWGGGGDGATTTSGEATLSAVDPGPATKTSTTKAGTPSSTKQATTPATTTTTTQAPTVDHGQSVSVLNSTKRGGLAASAATKLKNQGWTIRATGNYTGSVSGTTVFYGKGSLSATAQAVADDLGAPAAVQESADFGPSRVTVVLGADYPS